VEDLLRQLIQQHPTFGYRRLWVLLRFQEGLVVNRNAVYRRVVCASTVLDPAAPRTGLCQSRQSEQRTLGDGRHAYPLRRQMGPAVLATD
jgi:hypothetical protein